MRVVVLGAGTVGTWIADLLCQRGHSVTVVDNEPEHVRRINAELDVRGILGSASESSVLFQSDVIGADLCLAVTGVDEVNIVAASMARAMGARRAIARVYSHVFRDLSTFDYQRHFGIDRLLSLEHLSALELARGIRNPGSVMLENFARGELEVQEVVVAEKAPAVGVPLRQLRLPGGVRVGSIQRDKKMWIAGADDRIEVEDRIALIGRREDIDRVKDSFRGKIGPRKGIVIAGGGETGFMLARILEGPRFTVVLMESDPERCEFLAGRLRHTTVVKADVTRRVVLEEERVGSADVFVACTGDDESNIMAGVEARELGAKTILAVVNRPDYANVVGKLGIDLAVSPRDVMAKETLGYLNEGPVVSRTALGGGGIVVLEIEVSPGAHATEHVLAKLQLPPQCLIAAVMHENYAYVPGADDRLHAGDTVIALVEESSVGGLLKFFNSDGR
jgi:trk system potassium uptake protein TrkA